LFLNETKRKYSDKPPAGFSKSLPYYVVWPDSRTGPTPTGFRPLDRKNAENEELLDRFLPLHHDAVRRVTGVSAATLKKAILSSPNQFGPGVIQRLQVGGSILIRFNPALHLQTLKEKSQCPEKQLDGKFTGEGIPHGSGGPMAEEEKCAAGSSIVQASGSPRKPLRGNSMAPPPKCTRSGAEVLNRLRGQRNKSPQVT
jgi:hypothetical protein